MELTRAHDSLSVIINYKDEWPLRVGELIVDIAERYLAAHSCLPERSVHAIACYLESVAFEKGILHESCVRRCDVDATGKAIDTFESSVDLDSLRSALTDAAFEMVFDSFDSNHLYLLSPPVGAAGTIARIRGSNIPTLGH